MTDNITPQAPQTRTPMTTDEIIRRLGRVKAVYKDAAAGMFAADTVGSDMAAIDAAIQAVETLEEVKEALKGQCIACKHKKVPSACMAPCADCVRGAVSGWEFRWPLGEEAEHENK